LTIAYFNSVTLVGNATKAPEANTGAASGTAYTRFDLAVKHYKAAKPIYVPVVVFGPQQEAVLKYVKRGRLLLVNGRLDINTKGYGSVVASRVEFLGAPTTKKADTPGKAKLRKKAKKLKQGK
jgi:single-stranded DNA-binding protein